MKRNTIAIAALLGVIVAGVGLYIWMSKDVPMEVHHPGEHVMEPEPTPVIPEAGEVAQLERKFINDMIPHHEEAVVAAQYAIDFGAQNPEVRKLAIDIVTAQKAEIDMMKAWHVEWYGEVYKDTGTYQPMMRNISNLSGVERDKAFLEDMIQHHLHALAMVQDSAPQFTRPELKELAQDIASSQSNEVVAMKILLRQL